MLVEVQLDPLARILSDGHFVLPATPDHWPHQAGIDRRSPRTLLRGEKANIFPFPGDYGSSMDVQLIPA
jgi:hypothetical protein